MSLQGSFETIALTDVMALLASSNKSGELRVVGGQVEGRLWIHNGRLVGSRVGKAHGHVDAIFELLRLTEGNFVFRDGVEAPDPEEEPAAVDTLVAEAEERLKEWRDIEVVVPSVEHRVRLIADLPTPEVTLSAEDWRIVMAVALAGTVRGVLEEVALGQFEGCRGVKRLLDAGLVLIEPPRVRPPASDPSRLARRAGAVSAPGRRPALAPSAEHNGSTTLIDGVGEDARHLGDARDTRDAGGPGDSHDSAAPRIASQSADRAPLFDGSAIDYHLSLPAIEDDFATAVRRIAVAGDDLEEDGANDDEAVSFETAAEAAPEPLPFVQSTRDGPGPEGARGLRARRLPASPAVAHAQKGAPDPADVSAVPESDPDAINRGLLLKFLSSVRS